MPHAPAGPGAFPPDEQLAVLSIATSTTQSHDRPVNGWTLDEIAATILNEAHAQAISRATIWRILDRADLKPHKSVYWLNSHDPDFQTKAKEICRLYLDAPSFYQHGRLVLCCDEKTGMQVLDRVAPTQPPAPGRPERREFEYIRLGTRTMISTFVVPTGEVVWDLGPTRTNLDFRAHVLRVAAHFRDMKRFDWVVDNLNTHQSLELCEVMAYLNGRPFRPGALKAQEQRHAFLSDPEHKHVFHYLPVHGSWLNQVELFFSVVARQFLKRGDFGSLKEFEACLGAYLAEYNQERAHPYRWTYTGEPLVRATPAGQTRRQRRQGRAWFGSRPQLFERLLHPPRPYRRREKSLAANL
jgi:DDE superfamily endonuclease